MKKRIILPLIGLFAVVSSVGAQPSNPTTNTNPNSAPTQLTPQQQYMITKAKEGCQKPLGFFPTPAKIMCVLNTVGKTEKEMKPKALAIVFTVCQGRTLQVQSAAAKKYSTLGACLSDPTAVTQINKELTAQGFPVVQIVNKSALTPVAIQG